jgi:hypothetical protein
VNLWLGVLLPVFADYCGVFYVDKAIARDINILPSSWDRVKVSPWMSEPEMVAAGGCPEDLFVPKSQPAPKTVGNQQNPQK